MANIKLKLKPAAYIIDNEKNFTCDVFVSMLRHAGTTVTVDANQDFFSNDEYKSDYLTIEEDGHEHDWDPDMFENFPSHLLPKSISLNEDIDGNDVVELHSNGAITIGCQTVQFNTIEQIYLAAKSHKEEVAKILAKPKKKSSKKKAVKKVAKKTAKKKGKK